ncbi:MAG: NAD(+)/NADH kinase [Chloroflexota bacterium]|nr:NAD(+)/NADH kinase [Chloroflexota bacterium]
MPKRPENGKPESPAVDHIGLVAARSKPEAQTLALEIGAWLERNNRIVLSEEILSQNGGKTADAIVVLGGDGLMMRAANSYPDIPLLGINFGKVGFLALAERRDWQAAMLSLISGEYSIAEGSTLAAAVMRDEDVLDQGWSINDVVVRGELRMVDIEVYIDNHYVNTYPGDGMIVATPHGSTAYGMAAGGPILTAGVRGFAIVPISCHSPIRTPVVVSEDASIELLLANDREAALILDGRPVLSLQRGDLIRVRRGDHVFRLITIGSMNFYEAFRTKFNFQIRPDAVPSRRNVADRPF